MSGSFPKDAGRLARAAMFVVLASCVATAWGVPSKQPIKAASDGTAAQKPVAKAEAAKEKVGPTPARSVSKSKGKRSGASTAVAAAPQKRQRGNARAAAAPAKSTKRAPAQPAGADRPRPAAKPDKTERGATGSPGLNAGAALILDQDTREILLAKNRDAVQPIASLTKLMAGLVLADADLPLDEQITITEADVDTIKGTHSRLAVGTTLTRGELMQLALMSSENRAAHALARTFPGGMERFVRLMNTYAKLYGMKDTHYVEPTGLSSENVSTASDLAILVDAAARNPMLRQWTTSLGYEVSVDGRTVQYRNTNRLLWKPDWDIGLQKTGYIREAGRCLVMQVETAGRRLVMVLLDSDNNRSRLADAERLREWVEARVSSRFASAYAMP